MERDTESISSHSSNQLFLLLEIQLRERERERERETLTTPLTHNRPLAADRGPAGS